MENTFFVYVLIDPRNNVPFYVGISARTQKRRYRPDEHVLEAKRKKLPTKHNHLKIAVIRKILELGMEPIIQEVFEGSKENVIEKEIELIALYGRRDKNLGSLTNLTDGGEGQFGRIVTEKEKHIKSEKSFGKNNPMFGKNHSEEAKKSMSEKRKGKGHPGSERQREAAILSNKTRILSKETLKRMSDVKKGKVSRPAGFKLTEDHKRKVSEARKGKICDQTIYNWFHEEFGERQCRRVDLIAEFPHLRSEAICRVINQALKHHAGWKLVD